MKSLYYLSAALGSVGYCGYRDGVWGAVIAFLALVLGYMLGAGFFAFCGEVFYRRPKGGGR